MNNHRFPNIDLLLTLHNKARSKSWFSKVPDLKIDDSLNSYASDWAEYMANKNKLTHSFMSDIIKLGFSIAGENIAYGQKDEKSVMQTWLKSMGHKRNIMNKSFTHMGCGLAYSKDTIPYWCVCFGKKKN